MSSADVGMGQCPNTKMDGAGGANSDDDTRRPGFTRLAGRVCFMVGNKIHGGQLADGA